MNRQLENATKTLKLGKPVIFPTDTVWGIGVAVEYCPAPEVLYELKGRPSDKPIAWLVGACSDLDRYGENVSAYAHELAQKHWPGALTLVVQASDAVSKEYRSKEGTIGLRMPDSEAALQLIESAGCPIATTSANRSGSEGAGAKGALDEEFVKNSGAFVFAPSGIDVSDQKAEGAASTIVDCTGAEPRILRAGPIRI